MKDDFARNFRSRQVAWAKATGISGEHREGDRGRPWVLRPETRTRNLFCPEWWDHISGREHRWARALTSSQCFAVNLFAPLVADPDLARASYRVLYPDRPLHPDDLVTVELEFTPEGAREWLGERGQPTQVDACFVVSRAGAPVGYGLVEVKLTEQEFGSCRGARPDRSPRANPEAERCRDLAKVLAAPREQCWLAQSEGRTYWDIILARPDSFRTEVLDPTGGCPFIGGFYQLMRNAVLALCLRERGGALWADAGVCLHPANVGARRAPGGDIIRAFNGFAPGAAVREIDPRTVVAIAAAARDGLTPWQKWMTQRYF